MDSEKYNQITGFCHNFLRKELHGRHLEDLIQYVAMKHFESQGKCNWKWLCCDYSRDNGLNYYSKSRMGAKTLEQSFSIDAPGKVEESENSLYLLDQESISRFEEIEEKKNNTFKGVLEEFLSPLNLTNEDMKWTLQQYRVKTNLK